MKQARRGIENAINERKQELVKILFSYREKMVRMHFFSIYGNLSSYQKANKTEDTSAYLSVYVTMFRVF